MPCDRYWELPREKLQVILRTYCNRFVGLVVCLCVLTSCFIPCSYTDGVCTGELTHGGRLKTVGGT